MNRNKFLLAVVLFVSVILPLCYAFYYRIEPVVDAQAYDRIAVNLLDGFGFREDRTKNFEFDAAIVRAGPAYEFFLAGSYGVFGHHYEIIWILQALLHAISAYLIFLSCREIFKEKGNKIGLVAAVLFGLHPDLIEISAMLMSETLYLFFVVLVVWLFVKTYQKPNQILFSVFLAFTTALAILSRPPVILFVPIFLIFYILNKKYKAGAVFWVFLALALIPWAVRNYLVYHQFILTTLIGEYNLWVGNTLSANGGQMSGGYNPLTSYTEISGFFSLKQKANHEFLLFITHYPLVFIKLCFLRIVRYFSLIRPMGFWFYQTGLSQLVFAASSAISIFILFVSGFSGMILSWLEKNKLMRYLIALAITSPLVLIPTVVQSRYRFQIYPFLAIFGACCILACWNKKPHSWNSMALAVAGLSLLSLIDVFLFWPLIVERLGVVFQ